MQQINMFPSIGPYLQVRSMSNIKTLSVIDEAHSARSTVARSRLSKQIVIPSRPLSGVGRDLLSFVGGRQFGTILADPPWQFQNRTGKVAPEHKRLARYGTMTLDDIKCLPIRDVAAGTSHLYLWVPN